MFLNDAQEVLKENKSETLEKNLHLQLEENQQVHQRELQENGERLRRALTKIEKFMCKLSDREKAWRKELSTLQDLSELREARVEKWTTIDRELKEMLQKMVKQKAEQLQVRWFFRHL